MGACGKLGKRWGGRNENGRVGVVVVVKITLGRLILQNRATPTCAQCHWSGERQRTFWGRVICDEIHAAPS